MTVFFHLRSSILTAAPPLSAFKLALNPNWPGMIHARKCDDLVDMTDFLPTICEAAGVQIPAGQKIDGHSFLPQLRGEAGVPREWIYSFWAPLRFASRSGRSGRDSATLP